MKNSSIAAIFVAILLLSVSVTALLAYRYIHNTSYLQVLQDQVLQVGSNRSRASALAADAVEYSKRNPAIDPILFATGIKVPAGNPAATAPARQPSRK